MRWDYTVPAGKLLIGDGVRVRDVSEGASWTPVSDPDTLIVHVTAAKTGSDDTEEAEDEEGAEGTGGAGESGGDAG